MLIIDKHKWYKTPKGNWKSPFFSLTWHKVQCIACKKWCMVHGKKTSRYCSESCYHKNRPRLGPNSPHWKGGRRKNGKGYISIRQPEHCMAPKGSNGYVLEHRFIMSNYLKRPLKNTEVVHHINGIKTDNRIENLIVTLRTEHSRHHAIIQHGKEDKVTELS